MANRRQGYNNRPYYNNGPVNPWQVGNAPGGNNQGAPFHSSNSPNLLSQLTEPQAQLAIALTKLLQPPQQVPSLLTMNTVNPLQNNSGYGQNQNNNFSQRGRDNRRPRPDMKRNEPYNKMNSRNNRVTEFNRRRGNSNKSSERKIQPHRTTVVSKPTKPSSAKASPKPHGKPTEVKTVTTEEKDEPTPTADLTETSIKESDEKSEDVESSDKKRDWKEEKTNEESEENTKEEPEETSKTEKPEKEEATIDKKTANEKYAGIPRDLLYCLICQKNMWDGESFEKHLNGRAHQQMFEKVEESYRIKADMMREAIRLAEEKKNIEMDRLKRLGKKTKSQQLSRCAMCDLDFYGQLFVHRRSASHQKLKQFLHPRCSYCNKEFPTRMEWENHRHTPEHLRVKSENMDKKKDKSDEGVMIEDECFIVIDSTESDQEEPNAVLDITEDIDNIEIRIPAYKSNRSVGLSLITPAQGFFCKPCSKFFMTEKASQQHAQSRTHYDAFVNILNEKLAENDDKKRKTEDEDDEGNWKRRKTAKEGEENDETVTENESKPPANLDNGSELYDPAETFVSGDSNDVVQEIKKEETIGELDDEAWNEVDKKLDEILDQDNTIELDTSDISKLQSPKNTNSPATRRTTRGKKNAN